MNVPFLSLKDVTDKYSQEYHEAVNRVIDSGWYLQGKENEAFEAEYSKYIGTKYTVGCANGLDALILILRAYIEMGVMDEGDEIIVPANTYIATILAITKNNLVPVLVEPTFENLEIDDSLIESKITPKTKGIMIVHLYGRNACTQKIIDLCKKYNLKLMEDNAQAHGCVFNGKRTGAIGDAAAHSFYPGKNLGAFGDAGAVTTNDEKLAKTVRALANYGSSKKYVFDYVGQNSRLDEINAAMLRVKLSHLEEDNAERKKVAQKYIEGINNPKIKLPLTLPMENNVFHLFPIFAENRDELQKYLADKGITTVIHYPIAPHKQKCYSQWNSMSLPITERIADQELSLPMSPVLTEEQVLYVIDWLNKWD